jgi:hypothetical protein
MSLPRQYALASPPADGISRVAWLSPTHVVASSWDGSVTLFDAAANARVAAASEALRAAYHAEGYVFIRITPFENLA